MNRQLQGKPTAELLHSIPDRKGDVWRLLPKKIEETRIDRARPGVNKYDK